MRINLINSGKAQELFLIKYKIFKFHVDTFLNNEIKIGY